MPENLLSAIHLVLHTREARIAIKRNVSKNAARGKPTTAPRQELARCFRPLHLAGADAITLQYFQYRNGDIGGGVINNGAL
jgi:hypothetical protein